MLEVNKIHCMDCLEGFKQLEENSVDSIVTDPPYGLSFMGKKWDYDVPSVEVWKECFRVLKPGGFLLSFAGTRTYHRMAVNIEDAGFEIRDMISWLYGSGFPKSLNIGKQVDKIEGNEREVVGKMSDLNPRYATPRNPKGVEGYGNIIKSDGDLPLTKGNTQWEGWGTALKPACEPIVVARKPLSEKNVALNVLKWGTGGINIDGCRIGTTDEIGRNNVNIKNSPLAPKDGWNENSMKGLDTRGQQQGRFPANIILNEETGELIKPFNRFFYCPKASKSERNLGLDNKEEKIDSDRNPECYSADVPFNRSGNPKKNNHPTVKPIKLMQYLVRLVTQPNGIVLDPFIGSGTTAIACLKEGLRFIGYEKEPEYVKIAEARIKPFLCQEKLI